MPTDLGVYVHVRRSPEVLLETVHKRLLCGMKNQSRLAQRKKLDAIYFPGSAAWGGFDWTGGTEAVHALAALVGHELKWDQRSFDSDTGLCQGLSQRRLVHGFTGLGQAFRDAPGRTLVVPAGGMNEQDFQFAANLSIDDNAR